MIRDLFQDLRYGARSLRRSPGITAAVVLTLALGIGANVAIFGLVDAVVLRGMPVRDPGTLVLLSEGLGRGQGWLPPLQADGRLLNFSHPLFQRLRSQSGVFTGLAAQDTTPTGVSVRWRGDGDPDTEALGHLVSGNFFEVLGVGAALGRTLRPEDETAPDANPVVVVSHAYWQRRFGGDPALVGSQITLGDRPYTVVGVAAPGFLGSDVTRPTDLWLPLTMQPAFTALESRLGRRDHWWLLVFGRLAAGVSVERAQSGATLALQQYLAEDPALATKPEEVKRARVALAAGAPGASDLRATLSDPLWVLMAGVSLLLLIVCLNVAYLLLARAISRRRELSIRTALGASRGRLVRQLLAEGLLLSALGAAAALALSRCLSDALLALAISGGAPLGRLEVATDVRLLLFTAGLGLATTVLVGLVPAWQASRTDVQRGLGAGSLAVVGASSRRLLTRGLIAGQVAFSLVLLVGAGLLAQSLGKLRRVDKGFDAEHLLLIDLDARRTGLADAQAARLEHDLVRRLAALPGVRAAGFAAAHALGGGGPHMSLLVDGVTSARPVEINYVSPGYFDAMGMTMRRGRAFGEQDRPGGPRVVIVNEVLARRFLGGVDVVGKRFRFDPLKAPEMPADELTVVGVVGDAATRKLRGGPRPVLHLAATQEPAFFGALVVRSNGQPGKMVELVREAVRATHPGLRLRGVRTMTAQIDRSLFRERLVSTLAAGFGLAALFLVSVGLYAVIAQWAAQRRREIGLRLALGATRDGVHRLVLGQAWRLVLAGLLVGVPAALAASRLLRGLLYQLAPGDPATLALAAASLLGVATLAAYLPARRASRIEPMVALRGE